MNYLAENSLPIWMAAAIALTMALVVYLQTRSNGALGAMVAIVVTAAALLAVESWIETPREAVERTLYELAAAVEANDVAAALNYLSPTVDLQIRRDIEQRMPAYQIERARVLGTPEIELDNESKPKSATVKCQGVIVAVDKQTGVKGGAQERLTMIWIRADDRWLLDKFVWHPNWRRGSR